MKVKATGHNPEFLKRKAKKISKIAGITYTIALNQISKDFGYENWKDFLRHYPTTPRPKVRGTRPKVPVPAVLDYYNVLTGAVIGQHPNRKMSIRRHKKVGKMIRELLAAVEYYKKAKNPLQDVRAKLDSWLGCEYNQNEISDGEFNQIYYGSHSLKFETKPSLKRQAEFRRKLRNAKEIIDCAYHDCKPLENLHGLLDRAAKALIKWPNNLKVPGLHVKGQVPSGTFVRIKQLNKIGIVFHHDTNRRVVEGYSDGGIFYAGRQEVTVLKKQLSVSEFKPMRLYLPYGRWQCSDGREILFNRDYCPIWEKSASGVVTSINPDAFIEYDESQHYYDDRTAPYYDNLESLNNCMAILTEWGVVEKRPKILELLPAALVARDFRLLSPKGES